MYKTKDFYYKKIYNLHGKKLGVIKDIIIDFSSGYIMGFEVNNYSFIGKNNFLNIKNVISINDEIICTSLEYGSGLRFSEIKDLDVINKNGELKGEVEDIIVDKDDYKIKGIILGSGIIDKIVNGKEIILMDKCILGDDFMVYYGVEGVKVKNIPHVISKDVYYKKA